jgi:hypothetical protein
MSKNKKQFKVDSRNYLSNKVRQIVMFFDVNEFKYLIRKRLETSPKDSKEEFLEFVRSLIPSHSINQNFWLIDQARAWFEWYKECDARKTYP